MHLRFLGQLIKGVWHVGNLKAAKMQQAPAASRNDSNVPADASSRRPLTSSTTLGDAGSPSLQHMPQQQLQQPSGAFSESSRQSVVDQPRPGAKRPSPGVEQPAGPSAQQQSRGGQQDLGSLVSGSQEPPIAPPQLEAPRTEASGPGGLLPPVLGWYRPCAEMVAPHPIAQGTAVLPAARLNQEAALTDAASQGASWPHFARSQFYLSPAIASHPHGHLVPEMP